MRKCPACKLSTLPPFTGGDLAACANHQCRFVFDAKNLPAGRMTSDYEEFVPMTAAEIADAQAEMEETTR